MEPAFLISVTSSQLVPLALAIVAMAFLTLSLRRQQRARRTGEARTPSLRESPATESSHERFRRDVDALLVELHELSRRISAEIETRHAKLEAAIRDADRRIAALNRLQRQWAERAGVPPEPAADHSIRHAVVYELADAGMSPVEIARDIGKTPGEVELILNLRPRSDPEPQAPGEL